MNNITAWTNLPMVDFLRRVEDRDKLWEGSRIATNSEKGRGWRQTLRKGRGWGQTLRRVEDGDKLWEGSRMETNADCLLGVRPTLGWRQYKTGQHETIYNFKRKILSGHRGRKPFGLMESSTLQMIPIHTMFEAPNRNETILWGLGAGLYVRLIVQLN